MTVASIGRLETLFGFLASASAALATVALAGLLAVALPSPAARAQASVTANGGTPPTYSANLPGAPPLSFYNSANANRLVSIYNAMNQAAVSCNRSAWQAQLQQYQKLNAALYNISQDYHNTYTQIYNDLNNPGVLGTIGDFFVAFGSLPGFVSSGFAGTSSGQLEQAKNAYDQAQADADSMNAAGPELPKFPNCSPPPGASPPPPPPPIGTPVGGVTVSTKVYNCRQEAEPEIEQLNAQMAQEQAAVGAAQAQVDKLTTQLTDLALQMGKKQQMAEVRKQLDAAQAALKQHQQNLQTLEARANALNALLPCFEAPPGASQPPPPLNPPPQPPQGQKPAEQVMQNPYVPMPSFANASFYVSAGGSATFLNTSHQTTSYSDGSTTYGYNWTAGGGGNVALGASFGPLRTEVEGLLAVNSAQSYMPPSGDPPINGSTQATALMGNVIYDFALPAGWGGWSPHIGGGLGVAHVAIRESFGGVQLFSSNANQFAYQAIAGVSYPLAPNWTADLDYRYLATTQLHLHDPAGDSVTSGYSSHNIVARLSYHFGVPSAPPVAQAAPLPLAPSPRAQQVAALAPLAATSEAAAETAPAAPRHPAALQDVHRFTVRFDDRLAALTPLSIRALDDAVAAIHAGERVAIAIEGCEAGADFSGSSLCARRAMSLRQLLAQRGVPSPGRLLADLQ